MKYLNIRQIALLSKLSESSVRRLIHANKLSATEKNSNKEGFRVSVEELIDKGIATRGEIEEFISSQGSLTAQRGRQGEPASQTFDDSDIFAWRDVLYSLDAENSADIERRLKQEFTLLEKKKSELWVTLSRKRQECVQLEALLKSADHEIEELVKSINKFKN